MLVALAWEYACEERHGLRKRHSALVGIGLSLTSEHDITRFWVQDWVQLIEGRMAFPVRKRRQIGHLAYLLHWLRTRRPGVRVPPGAPFSLNFSVCASPKLRPHLK